MSNVIRSLQRFDQHVIDVYLHRSTELICEHCVDKSLVSGTCILQSEGHDLKTVNSPFCNKRRLLLIIGMHEDLIVSEKCIHE